MSTNVLLLGPAPYWILESARIVEEAEISAGFCLVEPERSRLIQNGACFIEHFAQYRAKLFAEALRKYAQTVKENKTQFLVLDY